MVPQAVYITGIAIIIVAFGIKSLLSENELVVKYKSQIEGIIFAILLFLIALHFIEKELWPGILAVIMGGMAIAKYLYDKNKETEEDSE